MNGQTIFMLLFGIILIAYGVLYVGGRHYLREYFQDPNGGAAGAGSPSVSQLYPTPLPTLPSPDGGAATTSAGECPKPGRVLMEYISMDPVAKNAIQSLDDYEMNYVFQNESDREASQALKNKLMSQRPMDWAGLPPSSAQFQAGLRETFENASPTVPDNAQPFQNVNGDSMIPPDTQSTEMEERKILQSYKPPSAQELNSYDPDKMEDPEALIRKVYDAKGLVPTVAHKDGTNVYEVVGVRRKDEKIVYEEEEAPAAVGAVMAAGEQRISVPPTAYDTAAARDPYYDASMPGGGGSRQGKWNYQSWTPGLERMFAPTNGRENWY